ncbi:MAG: NAD(P)H-hydrate dehydratase [Chloroflexi bacterium]|nr:NAD(P)H-hydrate dehydratase [Chloroflexota bacterium]
MSRGKETLSMKIVTVEQMRAIEKAADAQGLTYAEMMENAGRAVANWMERQGVKDKNVLVLVGPGKNGGDGLVTAYYLHQAGASVSVYCGKRDTADDANWKRVQDAGIPTYRGEEDEHYKVLRRLATQADWVVDALLGTGVSRPITGALQEILSIMRKEVEHRKAGKYPETFVQPLPIASGKNHPSPMVLALDVPSGLNCDSGAVDPVTLPADVTITLAFPKVGLFLFPGANYVGELVIADIGIPPKLAKDIVLEMTTPAMVKTLLPQRPKNGHKGTFGKVMVVAGSANYTGAPCLAASAALRVGAGLVTLGVPASIHPILAAKLSEATFLLLPHEIGALVPEAVKVLQEGLGGYDALLLGPGIGRDEKTVEFVARLLSLPLGEKKGRIGFVEPTTEQEEKGQPLPPLVIDADGLNALSDIKGWAQFLHLHSRGVVLTPHPGEMSRLLGTTIEEVEANRIAMARQAAQEWGVVVVLKGAYTVIASPTGIAYINPFANPALATAGTGDVLAGAVAGLLAQGLPPFEAAVVGAYLHGLAGQMVSEELGLAGAVAGDLLPRLPLSIRRVTGV